MSLINIEKIKNKHIKKQFLNKKSFNKLCPSILSTSLKLNQQNNKKNKVFAGTVIESGFFDWKNQFLSSSLFKNSTKDFPYNKINKYVNKNKKLSINKKTKVFFRLSDTKSFICFAGAGSGKTSGIVLPTIIANSLSPTQPNMLITDPKGELVKATYLTLQQQGYKVKILNILDSENTDCFSPFTIIKDMLFEMSYYPIDTSNMTNEIILKKEGIVQRIDNELTNVIYSLDSDPNSNQKTIWDKKGFRVVYNIAWLIIDDLMYQFYSWKQQNSNESEIKKRNKFDEIFIKLSFQSINETLLEFGSDGVKKYKEFYWQKYNVNIENASAVFKNQHKGLKVYKDLWRNEKNPSSSWIQDIISNGIEFLEKFNSPSLRNLTIFNTFDMEDLYGDKKQPFALFITVNNSEPSTLDYISWLINYILMKVNSFAVTNGREKLKKPLMCVLEEVGNIGYIKMLPVTVNEGRGKNIFVSLFFQTYKQYIEKYGNSGGDFARSCAYRVLLTNAEGKYIEDIISYSGTYENINQKTNKKEIKSRLTKEFIYSLPRYKALIVQNEVNIPYVSHLIPFQLLNYPKLERLNIKISDPSFNNINITYNPLSNDGNNFTLTEAIAIDFDFSQKTNWVFDETKKKELLLGLKELMEWYEQNNNEQEKNKYCELYEKLQNIPCVINQKQKNEKIENENISYVQENILDEFDITLIQSNNNQFIDNDEYFNDLERLALILNISLKSPKIMEVKQIFQSLPINKKIDLWNHSNESIVHAFFNCKDKKELLILTKKQDFKELYDFIKNKIEDKTTLKNLTKIMEYLNLIDNLDNQNISNSVLRQILNAISIANTIHRMATMNEYSVKNFNELIKDCNSKAIEFIFSKKCPNFNYLRTYSATIKNSAKDYIIKNKELLNKKHNNLFIDIKE